MPTMAAPEKVWKLSPLILLVLTVLITFPSVLNPYWSLVDDGGYLLFTQGVQAKLDAGRYIEAFINAPESAVRRYFHYVLVWLRYELFGSNNLYHRLFQIAIFAATTLLVYQSARLISRSGRSAFYSGLFFCLFAPQLENYYMLLPCEPTLAFLMILSFFSLLQSLGQLGSENTLKGRLFLAVSFICVPLIHTSKEIGIVFIPVSATLVAAACLKRRDLRFFRHRKVLWFYFLANLASGALAGYLQSRFSPMLEADSWPGAYVISVPRVLSSLGKYLDILWNGYNVLLPIVLFLFISRLLKLLVRERADGLDTSTIFSFVTLVWFASGLVLLSPWHVQLGRYLLPLTLGLSIFMGLELERLHRFLIHPSLTVRPSRRTLKLLAAFSAFFLGVFVFVTVFGHVWQPISKHVALTSLVLFSVSGLTLVLKGTRDYVVKDSATALHLGILKGTMLVSMVFFVASSLARTFYYSQAKGASDKAGMEMLEYLASYAKPHSTIFFDSPNRVNMGNAAALANVLFRRDDLRFVFAADNAIGQLRSGDLAVVFSGTGKGHSSNVTVTDNPNYENRLRATENETILQKIARVETKSVTVHPDAPIFNLLIILEYYPPANLGMFDRSYRHFLEFPQIVQEWKIYSFES